MFLGREGEFRRRRRGVYIKLFTIGVSGSGGTTWFACYLYLVAREDLSSPKAKIPANCELTLLSLGLALAKLPRNPPASDLALISSAARSYLTQAVNFAVAYCGYGELSPPTAVLAHSAVDRLRPAVLCLSGLVKAGNSGTGAGASLGMGAALLPAGTLQGPKLDEALRTVERMDAKLELDAGRMSIFYSRWWNSGQGYY